MKVLKKVVKLVTNAEATGCANGHSESTNPQRESVFTELRTMGLTPFEICNLINIKPKNLVCLQVIVDDMLDRLSEEQMNRILETFKENEK